jgi:hypothetical protein
MTLPRATSRPRTGSLGAEAIATLLPWGGAPDADGGGVKKIWFSRCLMLYKSPGTFRSLLRRICETAVGVLYARGIRRLHTL